MKLPAFFPGRNFIFYAVIGISGVTLDYILYAILYQGFTWNYLVASVVSTSAGITNNFIWNCLLNFRTKDRILRRFATFYGVGLLGLTLASALLYAQVEYFGAPPLIAKFSTIIIVLLLQYNLNKRYSFAKEPDAPDSENLQS